MDKSTQIKTIICGVALVALASVPPASAQTNPCSPSGSGGSGVCNTFDAGHQTNKFSFGTHFIKITAHVLQPFDLVVDFIPITQGELNDRLIPALAPASIIPYAGATSNTALGFAGFYHVLNPPTPGVDFDGVVTYRVFWDFPTLDQLNNVRLYRAPLDGAAACTDMFRCYTQDITDAVFAVGDHNSDPGVSGKGTGFSDFEAVDLTGTGSTAARVWIGLKNSDDVGTRFDLKAVVKKNGSEVGSSGTLFGALGGSSGFNNAKLRTIPLSLPTSAFASGNAISIELFVRNSCIGSSHNSGTARLWYEDGADSRVNEPGVPTLYLVGTALDASPGAGPKKTKDVFVGARDTSCNGPFTSFGVWSGTVPF